MRIRRSLFILPLAWALAGCVTDYSKSEAPNNLVVDGGERRVELLFTSGSARLVPADAIERLVASGQIRPSDRVTVAAAGSPGLAEQRTAVISRELLRYGIVVDALPLANVPANHAILGIGRYTVTLPPCPNWSSPPQAEYTNEHYSNWGCAAATNLGLMVANPADLVSGRPLSPEADGQPAVAAVERYLRDRVKQPPSPTASPFAASTGGGGGGEGGGEAPAAGGGGGTP